MQIQKIIMRLMLTLVVTAFVVSACSQNEIQNVNDVVVIANGNILTMNPAQPNATSSGLRCFPFHLDATLTAACFFVGCFPAGASAGRPGAPRLTRGVLRRACAMRVPKTTTIPTIRPM